jgi:hypothetical protein
MNKSSDPYLLFSQFKPAGWFPKEESDVNEESQIYSLRRDHGIKSSYILHNPKDEINDNREYIEKIIIEYKINNISYPLYTIKDLIEPQISFNDNSSGNIIGDIAERISRRITKYWLKHYSIHGKTGGIFDKRFKSEYRDDFIVANTQQYILKIRKYPNLVILKKTGRGKYGYENIKELDGLFDYRYFLHRYILVLESKIEKLSINPDDLIENLFTPLSFLFPNASFCYVLFTDKSSIYQKKYYYKTRQIKHFPLMLYKRLYELGIATIFFSFNETKEDFEKIKNHLITQYRMINKMGVTFTGRTVITKNELMIFDGGETPFLKLVKEPITGIWKEVRLTHRKKSK